MREDAERNPKALPSLLPPLGFSQHPDQHRPERPVLLAVDQQLGEGAALRVAPELADPVGSLEVREHEDVEQLGAGSGAEGVKSFPESALEVIWSQSPLILLPKEGELCDLRHCIWRTIRPN
jgi:hypothetical protein